MGWLGTNHPGWPARLGPISTSAGPVALRPLRGGDGRRWRSCRLRDEVLIRPWDPTSNLSWGQRHTAEQWALHRAMLRQSARRGVGLPFAVTVADVFAGQVTIGGVTRGPLQSAWVGYWVSSEYTGHGVGTAAVALTVAHGFGLGELHRIEATVAPENIPSQKVLAHLGFRQEALLKRYLDINGAWRDHQLWAMTVEEVPQGLESLLARWRQHPVSG